MENFSHDIKALKCHEEAAQKAHNESEKFLRDAKVFEKKLAENNAEIEVLNGEIRTSLALIKNYEQRLQELNDKLRGLSERENLEKEKLKSLGDLSRRSAEKRRRGKKKSSGK